MRLLSASFFDRQVLLYEHILESGAERRVFELSAPADSLARGLVAMEDGLGLQVVVGHPRLDSAEAERVLVSHASAVTGVELFNAAVDDDGLEEQGLSWIEHRYGALSRIVARGRRDLSLNGVVRRGPVNASGQQAPNGAGLREVTGAVCVGLGLEPRGTAA
jgi:hypothetical protein